LVLELEQLQAIISKKKVQGAIIGGVRVQVLALEQEL
jgi:hypothetical protein